jgi:hypothetical protein
MLLLKNIKSGGDGRELMLNGAVSNMGMKVDATHLQSSSAKYYTFGSDRPGTIRPGNSSMFTHPVYSFSIVLHESMGLDLKVIAEIFHRSLIFQQTMLVNYGGMGGPVYQSVDCERADFFLQMVAVYHCTPADESEPLFSRKNYDRVLISAGVITSFQFDINRGPQAQGYGRLEFCIKDLRLDDAFYPHMNREALKDSVTEPRSTASTSRFGQ